MEIQYWRTLYWGEVVGVDLPPRISLYGRDKGNWGLQGSSGSAKCGKFLSWVTGGTYRDEQDRERVWPGPSEFSFKVSSSQTYPGMDEGVFPTPVLFHFHGVVWKDARHTDRGDSLYGGAVSFTCSSFEIEEQCDTPIIVEDEEGMRTVKWDSEQTKYLRERLEGK